MEELIDIYDRDRNLTGETIPRDGAFLREGQFMLYVLFIVEAPDGRMLITQRSMEKHWGAGWWEIGGGGVRAGETSREAPTREVAEESIQKRVLRCDESMYYDMLSAFCKSLRGSDSDAALAWFARMNYAGVDPRIIIRRVIAHASEDVGLANPTAMLQAVAAAQALEFNGMPEARLSIAQAIIAVCESPKSNSVVMAIDRAMADAEKGGFQPVPIHLRDTHYAGHEKIGSGAGYKYPHDFPGHWVKQQYAPLEARGMPYYVPSDQGQEERLRERRKLRGIDDEKP